jgi:ribonuclease PH
MPYTKEQNRENYLRRKAEGKYNNDGSLKIKINDKKVVYVVHIVKENEPTQEKLYNYKWDEINKHI